MATLALSCGAAWLAGKEAHADESVLPPPTPPTQADVLPTPPPPTKDWPRRSFEQNVGDILVGRVSLCIEQMLGQHQALYLAGHGQIAGFVVDDWFAGAGAELGYRFYTGRGGTRGIYFGPSVFFAESYSGGTIALESITGTFTGEKKPWMTAVGGAVEAGYKWMSGRGFLIGSGFGVELRAANRQKSEVSQLAWLFDGGGVRPRVSVVMGQAF
jgi:hypothetical protein